jgi:hypothetical protein
VTEKSIVQTAREWLVRGLKNGNANRMPVMLLGVVTLGVYAFIEIADEMAEGEIRQLDEMLFLMMREATDPSRPLVLHAVQSLMSEPVRLSAWPQGAAQETRLVVITRDMPKGFVEELFAGFANEPGIGRADRDALTDNPLAIPGMPSRR